MNYKKFVFVISFLAILVGFLGVNALDAKAMTVSEIEAQITALQAQIIKLQKQLSETDEVPSASWCHDFNRNLKYGNAGSEVEALQMALTKEGFSIYNSQQDPSKAYFDERVASAVVGFQEKYAEDILTPWGLKHGTGYVGSTTREKLNELYGCQETPTPYIKVLSPNGGEQWVAGQTYEIKWKSSGVEKIEIAILHYPEVAGDFEIIATNLDATKGNYSWIIPQNFLEEEHEQDWKSGDNFKISVAELKPKTYEREDKSDNYFSIVEGVEPGTCHITPLWSWNYCSPNCKCYAGEGDCDNNSDCHTGYCAHNVGAKYGQTSRMDVCEEKITPTCTDTDGGRDYYTKGNTKGHDGRTDPFYTGHNIWDKCSIDTEYLTEWYCENNLIKSETIKCSNGCSDGACVKEETPSQPTADFIATSTVGEAPLTVNFIDTSTSEQEIISWKWDFDNDGTIDSFVQNPTYVYHNPGQYTVKLEAYETDGDTDTETKIDYVTVGVVKICGDVNCDGVINNDDVTDLFNYIASPGEYTICNEWVADVTGDGEINIIDSILLKNYIENPEEFTLQCIQKCGDVNYDGAVDNNDVTDLFNYIASPGEYTICNEWAADVTGDGEINIIDSVLLGNHVNFPEQGFALRCQEENEHDKAPKAVSNLRLSRYASNYVALEWDSNTESDIAGYKVFYGNKIQGYDYNSPAWTGLKSETSCSIKGLDIETDYYFVVRAFDIAGNDGESSYELYVKTSPYPCIDSDGGKDYYTKGLVNIGNVNYCDLCSGSNWLIERYCDDRKLGQVMYKCSGGCKDGACIVKNCSKCPDLNNDGKVDMEDFGYLANSSNSYGKCEGDSNYNSNSDLNNDGCVDSQDKQCLLNNYNKDRCSISACVKSEICTDGIDNDCDGKIDLEDEDCKPSGWGIQE